MRGVAYMVIAIALLSTMDAMAKWLAMGDVPVIQILALRSLIIIPLLLIVFQYRGRLSELKPKNNLPHLYRGLIGFVVFRAKARSEENKTERSAVEARAYRESTAIHSALSRRSRPRQRRRRPGPARRKALPPLPPPPSRRGAASAPLLPPPPSLFFLIHSKMSVLI